MPAPSSCEECEAIRQGLLELVEFSNRSRPGPDATPGQLIEWFERREEDDDYRNRVRPVLATLRRRWMEHYKLTGHNIPWTPPNWLTSPN